MQYEIFLPYLALFPERRCKGTSNIPPSPNFFAIFFHKNAFFSSVTCGSFTLSHFHASAYLEKFPHNYNNIYIILIMLQNPTYIYM